MNDFDDRHVVVTGGSGALGTAVCEELLSRGATVHVPVYEPTELDRFALRDHERVHVRLGLDLTVEPTVERYYGEIEQLWASVQIAGGFAMAPFTDTSLEDFLTLMNKNAVTCFLACREAAKAIRRSGGEGRLVNVASQTASSPPAGLVSYSASKAVVASLTRGLGAELGSERILVNAVSPATIDTPANRRAMPDADRSSWSSPADIAKVIAFLASPQNRVAQGSVIAV
jgi:NAD(P)-dependent dehydrogenase (short-subunit alcohol dehydrogenase family)